MQSPISQFLNIPEGIFYDLDEKYSTGIFQRDSTELQFWLKIAKEINGDVLELGCGTGRIATHLAQNEISITGIDISEDIRATAHIS